jgi:hypothetical protein
MSKKKQEELDQLERVSQFVEDRKAIYLQEHRDASTEVEKFIWSEMIGLLDEISGLLQPAGL